MRIRTKAREIALCILYQTEITKKDTQELFSNFLKNYPQKIEVINFTKLLLDGVTANSSFLDSIIKKYAKNWEIERMAIIDRNILRIAILELIFIEEIPPKVSINEAIELAKRFGDMDSPRFVNGILDKVYKQESKKFREESDTDVKS